MKRVLLLSLFLGFLFSAFTQPYKILVPYRQGKLWGYSDTLGNIIIKPVFDSTGFMSGGTGFVFRSGKWGVLQQNGTLLIRPVYDSIDEVPGGYNVIQKGKTGFITGKGRLLIPLLYGDINFPDKDFIEVEQSGKYGLYKANSGKRVLSPVYERIYMSFFDPDLESDKYFVLVKDGSTYLFHKHTFKVTPYNNISLEELEDFNSLIAAPGEYEEPADLTAEYAKQIAAKTGAEAVLPFNFGYYAGTKNYYTIRKAGKTGMVYYTGENEIRQLLPAIYDTIVHMTDNAGNRYAKPSSYLFSVRVKEKYGVVNEKGDTLVPFQYNYIGASKNNTGSFELHQNRKLGLFIPNTYYPVIPARYDLIELAESLYVTDQWYFAVFHVIKNGKPGFIGENGVEFFKD